MKTVKKHLSNICWITHDETIKYGMFILVSGLVWYRDIVEEDWRGWISKEFALFGFFCQLFVGTAGWSSELASVGAVAIA